MTHKTSRFYNPTDGTYINIPYMPVRSDQNRGKRNYNTDVLIGNWFEDRSKVGDNELNDAVKYTFDFYAYDWIDR
jgi:hypothetical protein